MTTNFLYAQAPNRKGNISKTQPSHTGGVTAMTNTKHGVAQPKGAQGAPAAGGKVNGRNQSVMVSRPKADYCGCNDGYLKNSSFLK
jgi:hypothetical protein